MRRGFRSREKALEGRGRVGKRQILGGKKGQVIDMKSCEERRQTDVADYQKEVQKGKSRDHSVMKESGVLKRERSAPLRHDDGTREGRRKFTHDAPKKRNKKIKGGRRQSTVQPRVLQQGCDPNEGGGRTVPGKKETGGRLGKGKKVEARREKKMEG